MSNKMTKKDYFNSLLTIKEVIAVPGMEGFIKHEIELLEKKNSAEKKPTAQQKVNDGIKDAIFNAMEDGKRYTITDLIKTVPECVDLSNQRVSALVRLMCKPENGQDNARLVRIEEKRKAYFSLNPDYEEE